MTISLKDDLENVYSTYKQTLEIDKSIDHVKEFIQSDAVNKIREIASEIEGVETYNLPFLIAVICHSKASFNKLSKKYDAVSALYKSDSETAIIDALNTDSEFFSRRILPFLDKEIMERMLSYENRLAEQTEEMETELQSIENNRDKEKHALEELQSELERINKTISEFKKRDKKLAEKETEASDDNNNQINQKKEHSGKQELSDKGISDDSTKKENNSKKSIRSQQTNLNKKIEIQKENVKKLSDRLVRQMEKIKANREELDRLEPFVDQLLSESAHYVETLNSRMEACYKYIRTGVNPRTESLFQSIIERKESEFKNDIEKEPNILNDLLKMAYNKSIHGDDEWICLLTRMFELGVLEYGDRRLVQFSERIEEYLLDNRKSSFFDIKNDSRYFHFFNLAIVQASDFKAASYENLWDEIESSDIWKHICEMIPDEKIIARIVSKIKGPVLSSFMKYLEESEYDYPALVRELSLQKEVNSEMIYRIVQRYDKKMERLERDLRRAKRSLDRQENSVSEKVFTAVYDPMEKLEMLTYDLKLNKENIDKNIIADQMSECVQRFRKSLEDLGIFVVESFDNWNNQTKLKYNSKKHRYESGGEKKSKSVIVKTLGYRYIKADKSDTEPEEYIDYAKVVPIEE